VEVDFREREKSILWNSGEDGWNYRDAIVQMYRCRRIERKDI
jgi:hypothetical protein